MAYCGDSPLFVCAEQGHLEFLYQLYRILPGMAVAVSHSAADHRPGRIHCLKEFPAYMGPVMVHQHDVRLYIHTGFQDLFFPFQADISSDKEAVAAVFQDDPYRILIFIFMSIAYRGNDPETSAAQKRYLPEMGVPAHIPFSSTASL